MRRLSRGGNDAIIPLDSEDEDDSLISTLPNKKITVLSNISNQTTKEEQNKLADMYKSVIKMSTENVITLLNLLHLL